MIARSKKAEGSKVKVSFRYADPRSLKLSGYNPRKISAADFIKLRRSLLEFGFVEPVVVREKGSEVIGGHQRVKAAIEESFKTVPVVFLDIDERRAKALNVALNKIQGEFDLPLLKDLLEDLDAGDLDLTLTGFDETELERLLTAAPPDHEATKKSLRGAFLVPPFSVLDSRQGYWRERREQWFSLGLRQLELGRPEEGLSQGATTYRDPAAYEQKRTVEAALGQKLTTREFLEKYYRNEQQGGGLSQTGTSLFDPVLCELVYRWFAPKRGLILDPFAGGSVRGLVAALLSYRYVGFDLRDVQVKANEKHARRLGIKPSVCSWVCADSRELGSLGWKERPDLVFSCPPYFDLERYSEDPRDLANAESFENFLEAYRQIVAAACALLKERRFAVFVVGEIRDKQGRYRNFVGETVKAFLDAGLVFYNEAIYVSPIGSLPVRVARYFTASRKLGKNHQNLLVFYKGSAPGECSAEKLREALGELELPPLGFAGEQEGEP